MEMRESVRLLIEELYDQGIRDESVLRAFASLDRQEFVSGGFKGRAYENVALPIDCGQTISQPLTVALMTSAIMPVAGKKVLEIGTGSGFQSALLARLGASVWSIERHGPLLKEARRVLERLRLNVATKVGDGTIGWREYAPFDAILVTAGAPSIPDSLVRQLGPGGILVVPVGEAEEQVMTIVTREEDDSVTVEEVGKARFVPLIGRRGWDKSVAQ